MGHWAMHIEGTGLHGNDRDEDAESLMRQFIGHLHLKGHRVHAATITTGATQELPAGASGHVEPAAVYEDRPHATEAPPPADPAAAP